MMCINSIFLEQNAPSRVEKSLVSKGAVIESL